MMIFGAPKFKIGDEVELVAFETEGYDYSSDPDRVWKGDRGEIVGVSIKQLGDFRYSEKELMIKQFTWNYQVLWIRESQPNFNLVVSYRYNHLKKYGTFRDIA